MHQHLWGYKVEEKLYVGVREQKRLNTTDLRAYELQLLHNKMSNKETLPSSKYVTF
jgi:hypothetical protein